MDIKVAIHHEPASFSDRWIECCRERNIPFRIVSCYASDIVETMKSYDCLLWHWSHTSPKDILVARNIIAALEYMGKKVFPNTATCWHFDDKVAQKYLLESVDAPLVPTFVFYEYDAAVEWIEQADFPKVFKIRRGAGSLNVRLVRSRSEAKKLAKTAFGPGFKPYAGYFHDAATKYRTHRKKGDIWQVVRRLPGAIKDRIQRNQKAAREKGYLYFQEFMPGNAYDIRVSVIGGRAFAFTRDVRPNDFRASGSGSISYDLSRIPPECYKIAFDVAGKIGSQSCAFDFIMDADGKPKIVEISYCYMGKAVYDCPGHWNTALTWVPGHLWPQDVILEDLVKASAESL